MSTSSNSELSHEQQRSITLRSPIQRKQVLRNGLTQTQNLQESSNKETLQMLEDVIAETDDIHLETSIDEKITNHDEIYLDSATMSATSKILKNCASSITQEISTYTYQQYASNLMTYVQSIPNTTVDDTPWFLLESEVDICFSRIPIRNSSLLGSLEPPEKKEIVKKARLAREPLGETKRPEKVLVADKEEQSVEETVQRIRKIIYQYYKKQRKPIDFFKLILHPTNFSKTIENFLHVSFLVRDNAIKITKDERGILVLYPCSKEQIEKAQRDEKVQNVLNFTMKQWKKLLAIYKLKTPMINYT